MLQAAASLVLPTDIRGLALATGLSSALYSAPNDSAAALTTLAGSSLAVEVILILVQMVQMLRAAALRKFVSDRHPQAVVAWQWHLLVFDRSALFSSLRAAVKSMPAHILSSSCLTLVTQLRHILLELDKAWSPASPKPSWRLHQEQFPSMWDVTLPLRDKQRSFSKIAFLRSGVVGVDVRSHQSCSCPEMSLRTLGVRQGAACLLPRMYSFPVGARWPGARLTRAWSLVPSVRMCAPYSAGRARPRGANAQFRGSCPVWRSMFSARPLTPLCT